MDPDELLQGIDEEPDYFYAAGNLPGAGGMGGFQAGEASGMEQSAGTQPEASVQSGEAQDSDEHGNDAHPAREHKGPGALHAEYTEAETVAMEFVARFGPDDVQDPAFAAKRIEGINLLHGDKVQVRPSRYGNGLFAARAFGQGEDIGEYHGPMVPRQFARNLPDEYDKIIESPEEGYSIIGNVHVPGRPLNYIVYANDAGFEGGRKVQPNADLMPSTNEAGQQIVVLKARGPIQQGQEITTDYGYKFWKKMNPPNYWPSQEAKQKARRAYKRKR